MTRHCLYSGPQWERDALDVAQILTDALARMDAAGRPGEEAARLERIAVEHDEIRRGVYAA